MRTLGLGLGFNPASGASGGGGGGGDSEAATLFNLDADVENDSATVFETDFTIPLDADSDYIIELDGGMESPASTSAAAVHRITGPTGATGMAVAVEQGAGTNTCDLHRASALADGSADITMISPGVTTERAVSIVAHVKTTEAGNLVIAHRRQGGSGDVIMKAGTRVVVRKAAVEVLAENFAEEGTDFNTVQTLALPEGTHLVEGFARWQNSGSTSGTEFRFVVSNATFFGAMTADAGQNFGIQAFGYPRTDNTEMGFQRSTANTGGMVYRALVKVAAGGGSISLDTRSVAATTVTIFAGSGMWHKTVMPIEVDDNVVNESDTVPSSAIALTLESGKKYLARFALFIGSSGSTIGACFGVDSAPDGAAVLQRFSGKNSSSSLVRGDILRTAALLETTSWPSSDGMSIVNVHIDVGETAGDALMRVRREAVGSGSAQINAGSWAVLEEVELAE